MTPRARCSFCGFPFADHHGADCQPQSQPRDVRAVTELARLKAKHLRFAEETNRILTEQLAEIRRLRSESGGDR